MLEAGVMVVDLVGVTSLKSKIVSLLLYYYCIL
jgi:hypothetical protein